MGCTVKTDIFLFFPLYVTRCVKNFADCWPFLVTLSSGQDIIPWSKSSTVKDTCLFKVCWEKKKKNTNISIFLTTPTYLKQTFVCLFFFFFYEPFPYQNHLLTKLYEIIYNCQGIPLSESPFNNMI